MTVPSRVRCCRDNCGPQTARTGMLLDDDRGAAGEMRRQEPCDQATERIIDAAGALLMMRTDLPVLVNSSRPRAPQDLPRKLRSLPQMPLRRTGRPRRHASHSVAETLSGEHDGHFDTGGRIRSPYHIAASNI